ncbi:class I SAM-dependent methyltransferase [Maritalea sp.]|uniref:class I SAM-dependent methyltransferase n=1 Tax=Maritalea sp. TaxID=2003361 RepID=UPI003EF55126
MSAQSVRFWDKQAKSYAERPVKDTTSYEEMLVQIAQRLKPEDKVLEIGCGTGSTAVRMAEHVSSWTAADISPEMIDIAKNKAAPDNANFLVAEADSEFADAPFDVVCAFHILHLVPDPKATLQSIFDQLKPDGLFISKTACIGEMGFLPLIFLPIMKLFGIAPPLHVLSKDKLEGLIENTGFKTIDCRIFGTSKSSIYVVAQRPH